MNTHEIFEKILTLGPSRSTNGGMASVLRTYEESIPEFKHLATNSPCGFFAGLYNAVLTFLRMPIERAKGRSILHIHFASGKSFIRKSLLVRWGKFLRYKIVLHCHSGEIKDYFSKIGIDKAQHILSKASCLIVLSEAWKEYFTSTFHLNNVQVVNNPVAKVDNPVQPGHELPLTLLFLGMLRDRKGVFDLLDVIASHKSQWKGRVRVIIGGDGEVSRLQNTIASLGLEEMVKIVGWVDGDMKESLFAESHILVLPSYYEGLPVSVLEGMSHGKAIISTNVGGIPEVVDSSNGFVITPGDKAALSAAISAYLLAPELLPRHGAESLRKIEPFYPDEIADKLFRIYTSLQ